MSSITPKNLLKFLKSKGFYISRQSGSHMILRHNSDRAKRVTLPIHNKDLKPGTLSSILKQIVKSIFVSRMVRFWNSFHPVHSTIL